MRSGAVKKIRVEDAKIRTASVEIKNIVVNNRKMTLSVFRQIRREDIVDDESLQLKGVPWGLVHYFWPGNEFAQIHVLWQKGQELRRSLESPPSNKVFSSYAKLQKDPLEYYKRISYRNPDYYREWDFISEYVGSSWEDEMPLEPEHEWGTDFEKHAEAIRDYKKAAISYLGTMANEAYTIYMKRFQRRCDLFDQLSNLEQLFIAT